MALFSRTVLVAVACCLALAIPAPALASMSIDSLRPVSLVGQTVVGIDATVSSTFDDPGGTP